MAFLYFAATGGAYFEEPAALPAADHPTGATALRQPDGTRQMKLLLTRFIREEDGSTALEYGLIAAGLSIAIITVLAQIAATFSRLKPAAALGN